MTLNYFGLAFGVLLMLSGCSSDTLPKYVALGDLRILALKANSDQAEVNPGTSGIILQPVVSDLNAGGRTLTATVQTCVDPGLPLGVPPRCISFDSNTTSSFSTATLSANGTYTGNAPTITVSIPATPANYIGATTTQQYNGVAYLVFYTLVAPDGTTVSSFKRITVSSPAKTVKNRNPTVSAIAANGVTVAATNTFSSAVTNFIPSFTVAGESYSIMNVDGTLVGQTETLINTWFYSDGTTKYFRTTNTDALEWTPPAAHLPGRASVIVFVSHDGRGGEDFQKIEFN